MISLPSARAQSTPPGTREELRRITQEMLDAVAPGRTDVWRRYLHERLIHVDETGKVRTKDELLKELTPLPAGLTGHLQLDSFKVEVHGDVAVVVHEDQEHLDYFGQTLRSRFLSTDTWLHTQDGWRLIAQRTTAVLRDPPTTALTRQQLCTYNGQYALTTDIVASVQCTDGGLRIERANRPTITYLPELLDVFFVPGQPRTRRIFIRDAAGKVVAFVDRREGEDIRWMRQP